MSHHWWFPSCFKSFDFCPAFLSARSIATAAWDFVFTRQHLIYSVSWGLVSRSSSTSFRVIQSALNIGFSPKSVMAMVNQELSREDSWIASLAAFVSKMHRLSRNSLRGWEQAAWSFMGIVCGDLLHACWLQSLPPLVQEPCNGAWHSQIIGCLVPTVQGWNATSPNGQISLKSWEFVRKLRVATIRLFPDTGQMFPDTDQIRDHISSPSNSIWRCGCTRYRQLYLTIL